MSNVRRDITKWLYGAHKGMLVRAESLHGGQEDAIGVCSWEGPTENLKCLANSPP